MGDGKLQLFGGKLLKASGKLATDDDCCCTVDVECECCDATWPLADYTGDWVVDFGAGGWSDVDGTQCDEIAGEITLPGGYDCPSAQWLTGPDIFDCDGSPMSIYRNIQLFMLASTCDEFLNLWRYVVDVQYWQTPGPNSYARFQSALLSTTDCLNPFAGGAKLTLSRTQNSHTTYCSSPVRQACSGTLPATIQIWPEPA